jgi:hypothetical protein
LIPDVYEAAASATPMTIVPPLPVPDATTDRTTFVADVTDAIVVPAVMFVPDTGFPTSSGPNAAVADVSNVVEFVTASVTCR